MSLPPPPIPNAYWVLPGQFMAGAYPAVPYSDEATRTLLSRLLDRGLRCFINLAQPGEAPDYQRLLHEQASWLGLTAHCHAFPLETAPIIELARMSAILDQIDSALEQGQGVYVHCRAGIGRTGAVVGCFWVRRGLSGPQALEQIAALRADLTAEPPHRGMPSPDSQPLRDLILRWGALDPRRRTSAPEEAAGG